MIVCRSHGLGADANCILIFWFEAKLEQVARQLVEFSSGDRPQRFDNTQAELTSPFIHGVWRDRRATPNGNSIARAVLSSPPPCVSTYEIVARSKDNLPGSVFHSF